MRLLDLVTGIYTELRRVRELLEEPPARWSDKDLARHIGRTDRFIRDLFADLGPHAYGLPGAPVNLGTSEKARRSWDPRTAVSWVTAAQELRQERRRLLQEQGQDPKATPAPAPTRTRKPPRRRPSLDDDPAELARRAASRVAPS